MGSDKPYFGDIKPFLDKNEDIGPATWPKLLSILNDVQKFGMLKIDSGLGGAICYHLEGDGPLVLDCFEVIDGVVAGVIANHAPYVEAIA